MKRKVISVTFLFQDKKERLWLRKTVWQRSLFFRIEVGYGPVRQSRSHVDAPHWQAEMAKIHDCTECGVCMTRCPYQLEIPRLLRENLADYEEILAGRVQV